MPGQKPRQIAVNILRRHAEKIRFLESIVDQELEAAQLTGPDRHLVQELCYGVVRWENTLDWLIRRKAHQAMPRSTPLLILRLGLYQLFWLDRIPDHAVVHESVELTKECGCEAQAGFINALLREYVRQRTETRGLLQDLKSSQPALGYSHPLWLWESWSQRWGRDIALTLLGWNNTPPVNYARLNSLKGSPEELARQWTSEKVTFQLREFPWVSPGLVYEFSAPVPIHTLPSFQQGLFYVQDPSTLLAVHLMEPQPKSSFLDYCAAPGGKTTYLAQLMSNQGYIMAQDLDIHRRNAIKENCDRLGVSIVSISRATNTINWELSEPFDGVLVDAPCSNTGVMRRRVDVRWRVQAQEIERLALSQLELLRRASRQVKPGGILVYSTCSLEPEENQELIERFVSEASIFSVEIEQELLPWRDGVDGAYAARLRRES